MGSEQYSGINSGRKARAASKRGQSTIEQRNDGSDTPF